MNTMTRTETAALNQRITTATDVARAMRNCGFLTHEELSAMIANLSALVTNKATGLSQWCALEIMETLDELADTVDADAAAQAEQVTA